MRRALEEVVMVEEKVRLPARNKAPRLFTVHVDDDDDDCDYD